MRRIIGEDDLREGVTALVGSCAYLARVHALAGDPPLRRRAPGFEGLARVIADQQLSTASAAAIWGRLEASVRPFSAAKFLSAPDGDLRRAGLSASKIATLRRVAEAIEAGALDLDGLAEETDETVHARLTALKGIGPWTADIYLLVCLGRADAWSPGDLALQHAVKDALGLDDRPSPKSMIEIAEAWRPWRAVAARLLWSHYRFLRKARS
ncbi:MAG: DNA-3-methyladenine glycosylase family protein [Methyloceanibacter sp.]